MAEEIKKEEKKRKTVKKVKLTDIKSKKSDQLMGLVREYDIVILQLRDGDLKLIEAEYS